MTKPALSCLIGLLMLLPGCGADDPSHLVLTCEDGRILELHEPVRFEKDRVLMSVTITRSARRTADFIDASEGKNLSLKINGVETFRNRVGPGGDPLKVGETYRFTFPPLGWSEPRPASPAEVVERSEQVVQRIEATGAKVERILTVPYTLPGFK